MIDLHYQEEEKEALLREHGREGKFRSLAVDKGWSHMDTALVPTVIEDYRAAWKDRKRNSGARPHAH